MTLHALLQCSVCTLTFLLLQFSIRIKADEARPRQTFTLTDAHGANVKSKAGKPATVELSITYQATPLPAVPRELPLSVPDRSGSTEESLRVNVEDVKRL